MVCAMRKAGVLSILFVVILLAVAVIADAQQPAKVPRIGVISTGSPSLTGATNLDAFRKGLDELGYVEGKTIGIEYRYAEGKLERLPTLAAEVVACFAAWTAAVPPVTITAAVQAAKQATNLIPIVVGVATD